MNNIETKNSRIKTYWFGFFFSIIFYIFFAIIISENEEKYVKTYLDELGKFSGYVNFESDMPFLLFFILSIIIIFILLKLNKIKESLAEGQSFPDKKNSFSIAENLFMRDMHGRPLNERQKSFSIAENLFLRTKEPWNYTRMDSIGLFQLFLADAVAIFGLLLFLLNGGFNQLFLFSGISVVAMLLVYPRINKTLN